MTATPIATKSPGRGRPLDPQRGRAILDAARSVLADKGYTGASMEMIAQTAGVGKDTLYRRWDSKEQLVQHLLTMLADEGIPSRPLDDDPRFGLFVFLQDIVRLNTESDFGAIVAGVVGESARNPDMAQGFRSFWVERRRFATDIVRNIVGRQQSAEEIERLVDRPVGPSYYRLLLSGDQITDEYLWELVMTIPWHGDPS
jgi:AcrR family transcriptional regulator